MEQGSEPPSLQRPRFVPEDALGRGRLIGDGRVRPGNQDHVGRALHEGLEPQLATPGVEGIGQLLAVEGQADLGGQCLRCVGEVDGQLTRGLDHDYALESVGRPDGAKEQPLPGHGRRDALRRGGPAAYGATRLQRLPHLAVQGAQVDLTVIVRRPPPGHHLELTGFVGHGQANGIGLGVAADQVAHGPYGGLVDAAPARRAHQLRRLPAHDLLPGYGLLVRGDNA